MDALSSLAGRLACRPSVLVRALAGIVSTASTGDYTRARTLDFETSPGGVAINGGTVALSGASPTAAVRMTSVHTGRAVRCTDTDGEQVPGILLSAMNAEETAGTAGSVRVSCTGILPDGQTWRGVIPSGGSLVVPVGVVASSAVVLTLTLVGADVTVALDGVSVPAEVGTLVSTSIAAGFASQDDDEEAQAIAGAVLADDDEDDDDEDDDDDDEDGPDTAPTRREVGTLMERMAAAMNTPAGSALKNLASKYANAGLRELASPDGRKAMKKKRRQAEKRRAAKAAGKAARKTRGKAKGRKGNRKGNKGRGE